MAKKKNHFKTFSRWRRALGGRRRGPGSREPAPSSGRKRPALPVGNAPGGEGAGGRAPLKDGRRRRRRRRPAAAGPEVTLGPAGSARSRRPPSPPYHEARESPHSGLDLLSVAPRDRITLLGLCPLCVHSSGSTAAKEGVPRQNLRDEWKFVIPLDFILCKCFSGMCLDLK